MRPVPLTRKKTLVIVILAVVCAIALLAVGTAAILASFNSSSQSTELSEDTPSSSPLTPLTAAHQERLSGEDELNRYLDDINSEALITVKEQNIHDTPKVDWKKQDIIAVQYSMFVAQAFKDVTLESAEGIKTIVITMDGPSTNCPSIQVNELQAVFIAVPKGTEEYPVAQRINQITPEECIK